MILEDFTNAGFKLRKIEPENGSGIERFYLSKLVNNSRRPPFYLYVVSIDATNANGWQIRLGSFDGEIACIVFTEDELYKAILVLTDFKVSSFV